MAAVTIDNITDEQIQWVRDNESFTTGNIAIAWACRVALGKVIVEGKPMQLAPAYVQQAKARVVAAWNATHPEILESEEP